MFRAPRICARLRMRRHRPEPGGRLSPPAAEQGNRRVRCCCGDGFCQIQQASSRAAANTRNPRLRTGSSASSYRRSGGKAPQTETIPARTQVAKRAEANLAQIPRAQNRPDIARALSSSGETGENNLEKISSADARACEINCTKRIPEVVRATSCERAGAEADAE